ncbi:hypothetical protein [Tardisphaera saccharovorans]
MKGRRMLPKSINVTERKHTTGMINLYDPKVKRIIKAMLSSNNCDKIIVLFDADGNGAEKMEKEFCENQCPKGSEDTAKIFVVAFETEVEEWITTSIGKREEKPSVYLRNHEEYEKRELPSQVERLNFEALKGLRSFKRFVEALKDP